MARLDSEKNILDEVSVVDCSRIYLMTNSEFEVQIAEILQNYASELTDNSGHDCLPPDYYSDKHRIMFDVMRINDTEKRKSYNPLKIKERGIEKEIKEKFKGVFSDNVLENRLFINAMPDGDYDEAHNYQQYLKNYRRVLGEHKKKIGRCREAHQGFKMGFMIYDETESYVRCINEKQADDLHFTFWDSNFIREFVDADIDFIVWVFPYKYQPALPELPKLCIIDLSKYTSENEKTYDIERLRSL